MTTFVTTRTWILAGVFALLYALVAFELVARDPSAIKVLAALAGAAAIAAIFAIGAARQRSALRRFVDQLHSETDPRA